jgi:WS/DGAT/MGAT family acyltransferase
MRERDGPQIGARPWLRRVEPSSAAAKLLPSAGRAGCKNQFVANPDRLSGLDSSFLHLEGRGAHMHVAACMVLAGRPPAYPDLLRALSDRLHLVPRYRQRLAFVPLQQGRPVWVDDPHFQLRYHVRHTALPRPGGDTELRRLAGRVFSQALDRARPLWELWLVEGLAGDRFALLSKTHHALVDGISGVDIVTVLFDTSPDPLPVAPPAAPWVPRPLPSATQLLADALVERATVPGEIARGARRAARGPRQLTATVSRGLVGLGALTWAGMQPAPRSPFNVRIGTHRRFSWAHWQLADLKLVKNALGGTVNDVVLTAVAGALGDHMRRHAYPTTGVILKALVPVSVRADAERGALGNRVAAMWAPLPVGVADPALRLRLISRAMAAIKHSGQAVGAQVLTDLATFAPPTILAQAARLQARQRMFNLVVTNIPGPQFPLYLLGSRMEQVYPMVPLAENTALGIAVMSYDGGISFGLVSDYDALPDLEALADSLRYSIEELVAAAHAAGPEPPPDSAAALRRRISALT